MLFLQHEPLPAFLSAGVVLSMLHASAATGVLEVHAVCMSAKLRCAAFSTLHIPGIHHCHAAVAVCVQCCFTDNITLHWPNPLQEAQAHHWALTSESQAGTIVCLASSWPTRAHVPTL